MPLTEPSERRLKAVRLTDIPLEARYAAAVREARHAVDAHDRRELFAAAFLPSDTVYYVTVDAQAA